MKRAARARKPARRTRAVRATTKGAKRRPAPVPSGFHTVTPSLTVRGAARAIDFCKRAFGAKERRRTSSPDGERVVHAELRIGDSKFWGDRYGRVADPFGHEWGLATHREDLSRREVAKRAAAFFAGADR